MYSLKSKLLSVVLTNTLVLSGLYLTAQSIRESETIESIDKAELASLPSVGSMTTGETSVVAGSGIDGRLDGVGTSARLTYHPSYFTRAGDRLYFTENNYIRSFNTSTNAVTTHAGSLTAASCGNGTTSSNSGFSGTTHGSLVEYSGFLYSLCANRLRKTSTTTFITTDVATLTTTSNRSARHLVSDGSGNFYYSLLDTSSLSSGDVNALMKYDLSTNTNSQLYSFAASGSPLTIVEPKHLAYEGGSLWMAGHTKEAYSSGKAYLRKLDLSGLTLGVAHEVPLLGGGEDTTLIHMVKGDSGYLYLSSGTSVKRFSTGDNSWTLVVGTGENGYAEGKGYSARFEKTSGMVFSDSKLYIKDGDKYILRAIEPAEEDLKIPGGNIGHIRILNGQVSTIYSGYDQIEGLSLQGNKLHGLRWGNFVTYDLNTANMSTVSGGYGSWSNVVNDSTYAYTHIPSTPETLLVAKNGSAVDGRTFNFTDNSDNAESLTYGPGKNIFVTSHDEIRKVSMEKLEDTSLYLRGTGNLTFLKLTSTNGTLLGLGKVTNSWPTPNAYGVYRIDHNTGATTLLIELPSDNYMEEAQIAVSGEYLYVSYNDIVKLYNSSGADLGLVAGLPNANAQVDGIGAGAKFQTITSLVAATDGVYVSDESSIRKITLNTSLSPAVDEVGSNGHTVGAPWGSLQGNKTASTCNREDPVDTFSGALNEQYVDLQRAGVGVNLAMQRSYSSIDSRAGIFGRGWVSSYEASLSVYPNGDILARAGCGQQTLFTHSSGTYSAEPGANAQLVPITGGWQLTTHNKSIYKYNAKGFLTVIEDSNGLGLSVTTDSMGRPLEVADEANHSLEFSYNDAGLVSSIELDDGRVYQYEYNGSGNLAKVIDADEYETLYEYNDKGLMSKKTDAKGGETETFYGSDNRVVKQIDPRNNEVEFSWNSGTLTSTMVDEVEGEWEDVYSASGHLISTTNPEGETNSLGYDSSFNLTSVSDGLNNTWTMTYDSNGNMLSKSEPGVGGGVEEFTWSSSNKLLSYEDANGNITTYEYDSNNYLVEINKPEGLTSVLTNNAAGQPIEIEDPENNVTEIEYNADGTVAKVTSGEGRVTGYEYTTGGLVSGVIDGRGYLPGNSVNDYKSKFTYNAEGLRTSVENALGHKVEYTYDGLGNLLSVKDPLNNVTSYEYDGMSNLIKTIDAKDNETVYSYDEANNRIGRLDARNNSTTYAYDLARRIVSTVSADGANWTVAYDNGGRISSKTSANGNDSITVGDGVTSYEYSAAGRLLEIDYSDSTPDVSFDYDNVGNRVEMIDGKGTASYVYDDLNRLTSYGRGSDVFEYVYDKNSNIVSRELPDGSVMSYSYDSDGLLESLVAPDGVAVNQTTNFDYDAAGNLVSTALPNGVIENRSWDKAGRLLSIISSDVNGVKATNTYTLDAVGNPTSVVNGSGVVTYSYDELNQLTGSCYQSSCPLSTDPQINYAYDEVGNKLSEDRSGIVTSYVYNDSDQLVSSTLNSAVTNYSYDKNGQQTAKGADSYSWDMAGNMIGSTVGGLNNSYNFDGDGTRYSRVENSVSTEEIWDVNEQMPVLALEKSGANLTRYSYNNLELLSTVTNGVESYVSHDMLGSSAATTDEVGALQKSWEYEPFGEVKNSTSAMGAPELDLQFTGAQKEVDGMYQMRARRFDTATSKFQSLDPAAVSALDPYINDYGYVRNRVTVGNDPSGEAINLVTAGIGAGIGAVVGSAVSGISYSLTHQNNFSWQRLGAEIAGGAVGGAASGGCVGFTAGAGASWCAAIAGPIGGGFSELIAGRLCGGVSPEDIGQGVATGLIGGKVMRDTSEAIGRSSSSKLSLRGSDIWKPSVGAQRHYISSTAGSLTDEGLKQLVDQGF